LHGYLANKNPEMRAIVAEATGIPLGKAVCKGCRNENGMFPGNWKKIIYAYRAELLFVFKA